VREGARLCQVRDQMVADLKAEGECVVCVLCVRLGVRVGCVGCVGG
jgi:hypothetical protein